MKKVDPRYKNMLAEHPYPWCWLCGRGPCDSPGWWHATWLIERCHIVNKPRTADRRAVVLLDSACHRISHGEKIYGCGLPKILPGNLFWLKHKFDFALFDRGFLRARSVQNLPVMLPPHPEYRRQYRQRRPESARILGV